MRSIYSSVTDWLIDFILSFVNIWSSLKKRPVVLKRNLKVLALEYLHFTQLHCRFMISSYQYGFNIKTTSMRNMPITLGDTSIYRPAGMLLTAYKEDAPMPVGDVLSLNNFALAAAFQTCSDEHHVFELVNFFIWSFYVLWHTSHPKYAVNNIGTADFCFLSTIHQWQFQKKNKWWPLFF